VSQLAQWSPRQFRRLSQRLANSSVAVNLQAEGILAGSYSFVAWRPNHSSRFFCGANSVIDPDKRACRHQLPHRLCQRQSEQCLPYDDDESGDVKGTIRGVVTGPTVLSNVRRHRFISISYISLLPCHGRGHRSCRAETISRRETA
jgi:hypothetical protein